VGAENPFQPHAEPEKIQSPAPAIPSADERPKPPFAWQPFTPRGIAAFAFAPPGRLFFVQATMAFLSVFTIVWFAWFAFIPEIKEAIRNLPAEGTIENQQMKVQLNPAVPLSDKRGLLGIAADPEDRGNAGLRSDFKVHLRKNYYEICFLLGCKALPYPKGEVVQFNRLELEPRWEAWEPYLLAGIGAGAGIFVFINWLVLTALYFPLVCLFASLKKRQLRVAGSWRLAGAALMPGAALLNIGIVSYGLGLIDLVRLFTLCILHILLGWVYLGLAAATLPPKTTPQNPFSDAPQLAAESPRSAPEPVPAPAESTGAQMDNPS
jgi:hypothetical protein